MKSAIKKWLRSGSSRARSFVSATRQSRRAFGQGFTFNGVKHSFSRGKARRRVF